MPPKFVPMYHPETGGRTLSPPAAVPHKQARGWVLESERTPSRSAAKAQWVEHAIARGMDRGDAKAATKTALVEQFGDVPDTRPDEPAPEPEDAQEPAEPADPEHEE